MGAPIENYKGYVEADLTQRARLVPSHSLYLVHGLADLTAPYTHGIAFAKALSEAGVIFRYQVRDLLYLLNFFLLTRNSCALMLKIIVYVNLNSRLQSEKLNIFI